MIVNNVEVRDISVEVDLVDVLGFETVVAACDYNWGKMEEYDPGTPEYHVWLNRWYTLKTELEKVGFDWLNPTSREIRARQGEDK